MKRFLAILLALVIPLQSVMAANGAGVGMQRTGCAQTPSISEHQQHASAQATHVIDAFACDCGAVSSSVGHHTLHHGGCGHLSFSIVAAVANGVLPTAMAGTPPDSKRASFESVVLDVPSPPPTLGA